MKMTGSEAIEKLRVSQVISDTETAHGDADDILCELLGALGYRDVVREWQKVEKRYA